MVVVFNIFSDEQRNFSAREKNRVCELLDTEEAYDALHRAGSEKESLMKDGEGCDSTAVIYKKQSGCSMEADAISRVWPFPEDTPVEMAHPDSKKYSKRIERAGGERAMRPKRGEVLWNFRDSGISEAILGLTQINSEKRAASLKTYRAGGVSLPGCVVELQRKARRYFGDYEQNVLGLSSGWE